MQLRVKMVLTMIAEMSIMTPRKKVIVAGKSHDSVMYQNAVNINLHRIRL